MLHLPFSLLSSLELKKKCPRRQAQHIYCELKWSIKGSRAAGCLSLLVTWVFVKSLLCASLAVISMGKSEDFSGTAFYWRRNSWQLVSWLIKHNGYITESSFYSKAATDSTETVVDILHVIANVVFGFLWAEQNIWWSPPLSLSIVMNLFQWFLML